MKYGQSEWNSKAAQRYFKVTHGIDLSIRYCEQLVKNLRDRETEDEKFVTCLQKALALEKPKNYGQKKWNPMAAQGYFAINYGILFDIKDCQRIFQKATWRARKQEDKGKIDSNNSPE